MLEDLGGGSGLIGAAVSVTLIGLRCRVTIGPRSAVSGTTARRRLAGCIPAAAGRGSAARGGTDRSMHNVNGPIPVETPVRPEPTWRRAILGPT